MNMNFPKTSNALLVSVALFCAGGACGWLMRGGGGPSALPVQSGKGADSRVASNGRDARTSDEADVAEPQFAEAISVEEFRRQQEAREWMTAARRTGAAVSDEVYGFPDLPLVSFHGLPGLLSDSLPDKFGNAVKIGRVLAA